MICANPDKVVQVGERLFPCAGLLADRYAEIGGTVEMAGKPFAPIYDAAMTRAREFLGRSFTHSEVMAIGDGLSTDMAGAARNRLPALFILQGIHRDEILARATPLHCGRASPAEAPGLELVGIMKTLCWGPN